MYRSDVYGSGMVWYLGLPIVTILSRLDALEPKGSMRSTLTTLF